MQMGAQKYTGSTVFYQGSRYCGGEREIDVEEKKLEERTCLISKLKSRTRRFSEWESRVRFIVALSPELRERAGDMRGL